MWFKEERGVVAEDSVVDVTGLLGDTTSAVCERAS